MSNVMRAAVAGFALGVSGMYLITATLPAEVIETRIFQREGKPAVMRIYKSGRDSFLVQYTGNREVYVPIQEHLKELLIMLKGNLKK